MIDHEHPDQSLLVQYGMAQANATLAHPVVPGWRARFTNDQDPLAQVIEEWIKKDLGNSKPQYPITYTLPGAAHRDPVPPAPGH
jgi:hypothetical protein